MACGVWLLLTVFSSLAPCRCQYRDIFNPAGPEYVGIFGGVKFSIYASVETTHAEANTLCSLYYHKGRLAWLGDLGVPEIQAIAEQASMINYLNLNHFFWIDGHLLKSSCNASHETCAWGPEKRGKRVVSHIAPNVSHTFQTANMACEKLKIDEDKNEIVGERELRPVLMPNLLEEFPDEDKDYVLAAAWNTEKSGFICSAPYINDVDCPFGFTQIETADVPKDLIPKPGRGCQ